jgi:hypothetical protein
VIFALIGIMLMIVGGCGVVFTEPDSLSEFWCAMSVIAGLLLVLLSTVTFV